MAAAGYGEGVCHDPRGQAADALAAELSLAAGAREAGGREVGAREAGAREAGGRKAGAREARAREAGARDAGARAQPWRSGSRAEALGCEIVCCVTPGAEIVIDAGDLRPGLHLNMLGADGPGKAEASIGAVASCALFCDEWEQASHGGELSGVVSAGMVGRDRVTELGAVLAGDARGRPGPEAVTLFDSTGLAIQDLAVSAAALDAWREGRVDAQTVAL
jgi:ornithine cyclodeaminase/alanine dehydrogenase-like protein (mu-crystallin family)